MRLDSLYQYMVPLAFIAIWAMTSIFNRETQPLPPRTSRPPGPNGPRPASPRSTDWRPESTPRESLSTRPSSGPGSPPTAPRPGVRRDDDILIIEGEPRRGSAQTGGRVASSPARRGSKTRSAGLSAPGRVEPVKPSQLSSSLLHPVNPPSIQSEVLSHTQSLKPLSLPPSPLLTTPNDEAAKTQAGRALVSELDSFSSAEIRRLVQIPARLREGFIVAELLKPPVSLRGGSRMPRRGPARES